MELPWAQHDRPVDVYKRQIPNCAATRHAHFVLDGSGQADYMLRRLALMSAMDFDRIFLFLSLIHI